jgi:hypothetical protein
LLEAGGERGGETGEPGGVDEGDFEQVLEVDAVVELEGGEFQFDRGFKGYDLDWAGLGGVGDVGGGDGVIRADFFIGEEDVDGVAEFGVGTVEEDVHAGDVLRTAEASMVATQAATA